MNKTRESAARRNEIDQLRQENRRQADFIRELQNDLVKYKAIFEGSSEAMFLLQDTVIDCNAQACRIWKSEKDDIIGSCPYDFAPPTQPNGGDSKTLAEARIKAAMNGAPQRFLWRDRKGEDGFVDTEVHLRGIDLAGEVYIVATVSDITNVRREEEDRKELYRRIAEIIQTRGEELEADQGSPGAEDRYRHQVENDLLGLDKELNNAFESAPDGLIVTDSRRNILKINPSFARMSGYGFAQVGARKCYQVFTCKGCTGGACRVARMLRGQNHATFETECFDASGEKLSCQLGASALKDSKGATIGMAMSYRNITEYNRWVDAMRHSEELHRITLASISDAVFITDDLGYFYYVSPSVENLLGYSQDEAFWKGNIFHILGDAFYDPEQLEARGELVNIELVAPDKFGRERVLMVNVKKVAIQSGTVLVTCHDITDKRLAELEAQLKQEQLEQAGKMVSLGILVSGVAHEINNPNNFILMNTQIMDRIWKDTVPILDRYRDENGDFLLGRIKYAMAREKMPDLLSAMEEGSKRIKNIVTELKNYSRHDSTDMEQMIFVNSVVKHSLALLDSQIKKATNNFRVDYCHRKPMVLGNFQKIEQVVINLVQNACEALEDKDAEVTVETLADPDSGCVIIEVRDQGTGIKPEDMIHITDPFFTTKRTVGGTGLGLSVSAKIVQEHGGHLGFDSRPNQGTLATLTLPMIMEDDLS